VNAHAAAHWPALLQLASSALPVGGFGYSQGLESAVELQQVRDEPSAAVWIGDLLQFGFARADARWWQRAAKALQANEIDQFPCRQMRSTNSPRSMHTAGPAAKPKNCAWKANRLAARC